MPDETPPETGACPFCHCDPATNTVLHEGRDFYVMADYAPLAEGHLLLIPRRHFACLADMPPHMDVEFGDLKALMGRFIRNEYGSAAFWENGIFGQSVPHAHLHALSWRLDERIYRGKGPLFEGLAGLRDQRSRRPGQYFTVEHAGEARFLPPDAALSRSILEDARRGLSGWRLGGRDERRANAGPGIDELRRRWELHVANAGLP